MNSLKKIEKLRELAYDNPAPKAMEQLVSYFRRNFSEPLDRTALEICTNYLDILKKEVSQDKTSRVFYSLIESIWGHYIRQPLSDLLPLEKGHLTFSYNFPHSKSMTRYFPFCSVEGQFLKKIHSSCVGITFDHIHASVERCEKFIYEYKLSYGLRIAVGQSYIPNSFVMNAKVFVFEHFSQLNKKHPLDLKDFVYFVLGGNKKRTYETSVK